MPFEHSTASSFLSPHEEYGYWSFFSKEKQLFFDASCARILNLGTQPCHLNHRAWQTLLQKNLSKEFFSHLRRWIQTPYGGDKFIKPTQLKKTYKTITLIAAVLVRNRHGLPSHLTGSLHSLQEEKTHTTKVEEMQRTLLAMNLGDGVWEWDVTNNTVYFSERYRSMLGHTEATYPNKAESWLHAIHPDDYEKTLALQAAVANSPKLGDSFTNTYRIRHADGSYLWIMGRGFVTSRDKNGRARCLIGIHTELHEFQHNLDEMEALLHTDPLTGLRNRLYFEQALHKVAQQSSPMSIVAIDVNGLKLINDYLGHAQGDALLCATAKLLSHHAHQYGVIARIGGDEFVLLLNLPPQEAQSVVYAIQQDKTHNPCELPPIELSFGIAGTLHGCKTPELLIHDADRRMLQEKLKNRKRSHQRIKHWIEKNTGKTVTLFDERCFL